MDETHPLPAYAPLPVAALPPRRERIGRTPVVAGVALLVAGGVAAGAAISNASHHDSAAVSTGSGGGANLAVSTATLNANGVGSAVSVASALDPAVATIVVQTSVTNRFGGTGTGTAEGSGFVVSNSGGLSYLLTNNHVVAGADSLQVILSSGKSLPGTVVGTDTFEDLAVVSVQAGNLPQVVFGRSADLRVGQAVVAIGSPLGNQNSVTSGVISALHRSITAGGDGTSSENLGDVLQTDAAINPGNSGGPLADMAGRVIGVNVATSSNGTNVSFSIPSDEAQRVARALIVHQTPSHPYLGIGFLTPLDAATSGRSFSGPGVLVTEVAPGSPAESAGLRAGDVISAIGGTALDSTQTVGGLISGHSVGDRLSLTVLRDGQTLTLSATLVQRPSA
jgi:S1-C subfamily serine protease